MIQQSYNIDKFIKSPSYVAKYTPCDTGKISYILYNTHAPHERIRAYKNGNHLDIYKFNNMNSEYYESISLGTARGKKLEDILFSKRIAAIMQYIDTHFTDTPHR